MGGVGFWWGWGLGRLGIGVCGSVAFGGGGSAEFRALVEVLGGGRVGLGRFMPARGNAIPGCPLVGLARDRAVDPSLRAVDPSLRAVDPSLRAVDPSPRAVGSSCRNIGASCRTFGPSRRTVGAVCRNGVSSWDGWGGGEVSRGYGFSGKGLLPLYRDGRRLRGGLLLSCSMATQISRGQAGASSLWSGRPEIPLAGPVVIPAPRRDRRFPENSASLAGATRGRLSSASLAGANPGSTFRPGPPQTYDLGFSDPRATVFFLCGSFPRMSRGSLLGGTVPGGPSHWGARQEREGGAGIGEIRGRPPPFPGSPPRGGHEAQGLLGGSVSGRDSDQEVGISLRALTPLSTMRRARLTAPP